MPACSSVRPPDACVVLTGANGTLSAPISGFAGETGASLRARAAGLVSPGMRDALFALGPLLPAVAEFGSYSKDFLGLIWPERFASDQKLLRGRAKEGLRLRRELRLSVRRTSGRARRSASGREMVRFPR